MRFKSKVKFYTNCVTLNVLKTIHLQKHTCNVSYTISQLLCCIEGCPKTQTSRLSLYEKRQTCDTPFRSSPANNPTESRLHSAYQTSILNCLWVFCWFLYGTTDVKERIMLRKDTKLFGIIYQMELWRIETHEFYSPFYLQTNRLPQKCWQSWKMFVDFWIDEEIKKTNNMCR